MSDYKSMAKKGFRPLTEIETETRYYFQKVEGSEVQGVLISRHRRPGDEDQFFYELECTKKCSFVTALVYDEESGESVEVEDSTAKIGDIVRVDETHGTMDPILAALAKPVPQEIIIECIKKKKIKNSNKSFWRMGVWAKDAE